MPPKPTIVLATDGSALSETAVAPVLQLAKSFGARVTFVRVTAPYVVTVVDGMAVPYPTEEDVERAIALDVGKQFARLEAKAEAERVASATRHIKHAQPWRGILATAEQLGAMMIAVTSHGRGGIGSLLIGSETLKILSHSKIPVIVYR